jgi:U-box domain
VITTSSIYKVIDFEVIFHSTTMTTNKSLSELAKSFGISVPDEFICPITLDVMVSPVMTINGIVYERSHIIQWIQATSSTCPITRTPLSLRDLVSHRALEDKIARWKFEYCLDDYNVPLAINENAFMLYAVSSAHEKKFEKIFEDVEKKNPSRIKDLAYPTNIDVVG